MSDPIYPEIQRKFITHEPKTVVMKILPLPTLRTSTPVVTDPETNIPSVPIYIHNDTMPTVVSFSFVESPGKLLPQVVSKNSNANDPVKVNDELAIANNSTIKKPMITNDDMAL